MGAAASTRLACALSGCNEGEGAEREGRSSMDRSDYAASGVASVINVAARNRGFMDTPPRGYDRRPSSSLVVHRGICCSRQESLAQRFVNEKTSGNGSRSVGGRTVFSDFFKFLLFYLEPFLIYCFLNLFPLITLLICAYFC